MGCCFRAAPSSSFPFGPPRCINTAAVTGGGNFTLFKSNAIFYCNDGRADSTSSKPQSYSRRWYNPLNRKRAAFSITPDIVRHWVSANFADNPLQAQEKFTVVSYNILGDRNASKHWDLYRNVPSIYLKWEYRRSAICDELIGMNPDIICLQEVDMYCDLLNIMEKVGYLGSYKRRTGDSVDGCAIFWRADKQMCKDPSRRILVGNIHVLYNPRRGEVKLGQIRFLASRAHILSTKWGNTPVVLAGDYNSTPQSAIYKFLSSSELDIMVHDRRDLSGQKACRPTQALGLRRQNSSLFVLMDRFLRSDWTGEEVQIATGSSNCRVVRHPLKINSSYATVKGSTRTRGYYGEPLATSYHSKFLGTVDYLWYTRDLVPTKVLDTVPTDVLKRTGGLPSKKLGSDHLALVSEFAFVQGREEENESSSSMAL